MSLGLLEAKVTGEEYVRQFWQVGDVGDIGDIGDIGFAHCDRAQDIAST